MDVSLLARGLLLGFAIAAPVGPIGVLCIRRTLVDGWRIGFVSGLGAATADGFYGAVAAFGLTAISTLLTSGQLWLRLVGGIFLCYLGIRGFLAKPATQVDAQLRRGGQARDAQRACRLRLHRRADADESHHHPLVRRCLRGAGRRQRLAQLSWRGVARGRSRAGVGKLVADPQRHGECAALPISRGYRRLGRPRVQRRAARLRAACARQHYQSDTIDVGGKERRHDVHQVRAILRRGLQLEELS